MCYLEENSSEVLILLARGSLPVDLFKANGAQILYLSLFAIAWLSASTFLLYHFKFVPKIATYVEQRFDKKLITDANNHLDPLECVDIKCRRDVRPDSRVTDQTDIPYREPFKNYLADFAR